MLLDSKCAYFLKSHSDFSGSEFSQQGGLNTINQSNITRLKGDKFDDIQRIQPNHCLISFTCINNPGDLIHIKAKRACSNYAFLLVLDGTAQYTFNNTKLSADSDCGMIHLSSNEIKVQTESIKAIWIEFKTKAIDKKLDKRLGPYYQLIPELIKIEYKTPKENLLRSLCLLSLQQLNFPGFNPTQSKAWQHLEKSILNAFIDCIDRRIEERSNDAKHQYEWLETLQKWIDKHLGEPIKLQDLADSVGLSRRSLQKLVRNNMDCTPMEMVCFRRLMKARNLLQSPDQNTSVLNVSLEVGFTHPSRFASQYKKQFHEKPSVTLKKAREE